LSQSQVQNTVARLVGPPKIAVVLYDYTAQTPEELSIKEGENLMILEDSDPHWWKVRIVSKKGGEGLVPATYIQVWQMLFPFSSIPPLFILFNLIYFTCCEIGLCCLLLVGHLILDSSFFSILSSLSFLK